MTSGRKKFDEKKVPSKMRIENSGRATCSFSNVHSRFFLLSLHLDVWLTAIFHLQNKYMKAGNKGLKILIRWMRGMREQIFFQNSLLKRTNYVYLTWCNIFGEIFSNPVMYRGLTNPELTWYCISGEVGRQLPRELPERII